MAIDATFVSVWDDGAFSVESPCELDLETMRVTAMMPAVVAYDEDGNETRDENELDIIFNEVEHLDYEYVTADGARYSAAREGDDADDRFGNGIVVYPD